MEEKRSGAIPVISSVQGKLGLPFRTSYAASKHALQGFYDSLRAEVISKNIRLTTISPGYVKTNLSLNALNGDGSSYGKLDETTANGMNPSALAKIVLKSINENKKDVVIADSKTVSAIQLNVMFPDITAWIMAKRAKKG
jgi:dehydrogenase/reductase SDR family protein 7B